MKPLIGVLGGMGPAAAVDLMQKLVEETSADSDWQQIPVVCWNVPQIPDRQQALSGAGESPLSAMQAGIDVLNGAGATRIAIACNTAHYWYDALAAGSRAPILHIADITLEAMLHGTRSGELLTRVGIIATSGTIDAGLYQSRLGAHGIDCIVNSADEQQAFFHPGCQAVKQGNMEAGAAFLQQAAQRLVARGAQRLLLACTEVPLALERAGSPYLAMSIDPTRALARACAMYWMENRRNPQASN